MILNLNHNPPDEVKVQKAYLKWVAFYTTVTISIQLDYDMALCFQFRNCIQWARQTRGLFDDRNALRRTPVTVLTAATDATDKVIKGS